MRALRLEIESAFGVSTRLMRMVVGPVLLVTSKREDRRLAKGVTYEPPTFVERQQLGRGGHAGSCGAASPQ